jgi:hypothetical protein
VRNASSIRDKVRFEHPRRDHLASRYAHQKNPQFTQEP